MREDQVDYEVMRDLSAHGMVEDEVEPALARQPASLYPKP